ncbi:hypothetical protein D9615_002682 [Tricholomella constricta]|uniref:Uncharacterized protein n=1 Tax=Tricholomella constricta TaxID=117010 RepID=A0A8H5M9V6_9AGAR|nr:hypothetical protein D9615_002682 [Tricholomella constricta]
MASRQTKKQRKGRNNPNNRERTVTTLAEAPNTPYLVPTPSEEPAGATLMSSPFSVASSSAGNPVSSSAYQPPSNYAAFGYNNSFGTPMHGPVHNQQIQPQHPQSSFYPPQQQQQQQGPSVMRPPGRNDLELLENLKKIIKDGQHEQFRPEPQPGALASLYLGTLPSSLAQAIHPEQVQYSNVTDGPSQANQAAPSGPSSPVDLGRRPPRLQSKEGWDPTSLRKPLPGSTASGAQPTNNTTQASYGGRYNQGSNQPTAIDTSDIHANGKTNLAGPPSAGFKSSDVHMADSPAILTASSAEGPGPTSPRPSRFEPSSARSASGNSDQPRVPADRLGHGEPGYGGSRGSGNISPEKSSFDPKDDLRRDNAWSAREGQPPSDDKRRELDHPLPSPTSRPVVNGNGGGSDTRSNAGDRVPPVPRDDRIYDRDRERDRERDYRDRRDWERDRRPPYDRFRGMSDARRPPPEQRHYEPDYDRVSRRYEVKEEPLSDARRLSDVRPPPPPATVDDRAAVRPVDDRHPSAASRVPPISDPRAPVDSSRPPHPDSRASLPDSRALPPDNRPARVPSFDDRHVKAPPADERRGAPLPADDRVPPPAARPANILGASGPADDRNRDVNMAPVEDRNSSRPQVPLEERISRPSLQDRLSQPPASRPEPSHISRQASLEERLSAIPVSADSREQRGRVPDRVPPRPGPPLDDRSAGRALPPPPSSAHDDRRVDDRSGRYGRPSTPPPTERATYPPPHAGSVVRDDPRSVKGPPSPPSHRPVARDYRASGRPLSRERLGGPYRPEDRNYIPDDRRSDTMDVEGSSRFSDSRSVPYNRPFSPPSAADLARDRARTQFPPSPPRAPVPLDAPPYDDDRRYPPGREWSYQQSYSTDRRREWSAADEEYYKSRQWDRNLGPPPSSSVSDRDHRFDREPPPPPPPPMRNHGWETRDERDRRDFQRPPSPSRSYDGPPRPLSSRLTDTFGSSAPGGAPSDRSYAPPPPPREAMPPMFSRVRQRSPSPARRPGGPPLPDDTRPPIKRPREEAYASEFYPPPPLSAQSARGDLGPGPPRGRPQESYPPLSRGNSPPPTSGASSGYFERSGPPPPPSGGTGTSAGDREYPPREYPMSAYERPRSPGPGSARGYVRGGGAYPGSGRDDRRYLPAHLPPPPSSSSSQAMLPPGRRP